MLPLSALVIIMLGSFFHCCNARCSIFVKTDLLRFCMVETTFPRIRSASLGGMPGNLSSAEARMSFVGTSLGAIATFKTRPNTWTWSSVKVLWDRLTTHLLEGFELFFCCEEFVFSKDDNIVSCFNNFLAHRLSHWDFPWPWIVFSSSESEWLRVFNKLSFCKEHSLIRLSE